MEKPLVNRNTEEINKAEIQQMIGQGQTPQIEDMVRCYDKEDLAMMLCGYIKRVNDFKRGFHNL